MEQVQPNAGTPEAITIMGLGLARPPRTPLSSHSPPPAPGGDRVHLQSPPIRPGRLQVAPVAPPSTTPRPSPPPVSGPGATSAVGEGVWKPRLLHAEPQEAETGNRASASALLPQSLVFPFAAPLAIGGASHFPRSLSLPTSSPCG